MQSSGPEQGHGRLRRDPFAATGEAEALGRGRLYINAAGIDARDFGQPCPHGIPMRADLRSFADDRYVEIAEPVAGFARKLQRVGEEAIG